LAGLLWTRDLPERRDLYLTTYNKHKRKKPMPPAVFEPTIPASKRLQTNTVDREAADCSKNLAKDYVEEKERIFCLPFGKCSNVHDVVF
jgi:hypothetical protein